MRLNRRRLITGMVLVLWALLGPIGMAFSSCATMGSSCTVPCALTPCIMPVLPSPAALLVTSWQVPDVDYHASTIIKVPVPPPKSLAVSA